MVSQWMRGCRAGFGVVSLMAAMLLAGCATEVRHAGLDTAPVPGAEPVLAFQNPKLTPHNGGRLAGIEQLRPGDIILSAGRGVTAMGIQMFTLAPVSHAALYVGKGEIIEAVGKGVQRRMLDEALESEAVAAAFRYPDLQDEQARKISEFAEAQVGKNYNHVGVLLQAPFAIERRVCELPVIPSIVRDFCIRGVAAIQLGVVSEDSFFCSQFVLEAYRVAGAAITDADPRWISPADILHMREGDVPSLRVRQQLSYVGHLKYRESVLENQ